MEASLFQVKICGVTRTEDAVEIAAAGADAVGLNFYAPSPRFVTREAASRIAAVLPRSVQRVGVFVNLPVGDVLDIAEQVGLDLLQLHGDEPPEFLQQLVGRPVLRAFRCRDCGLDTVVDYLDRCRELDCLPHGVLIDAFQPGSYGGTGRVVDWSQVPRLAERLQGTPIILAGGLTADNVALAIRTARPDGVDTASGVECSPGKKDPGLVCRYVQAAKAAFQAVARCAPQRDLN